MNKDINRQLRKRVMEHKKNNFNYVQCIKEMKKNQFKLKSETND